MVWIKHIQADAIAILFAALDVRVGEANELVFGGRVCLLGCAVTVSAVFAAAIIAAGSRHRHSAAAHTHSAWAGHSAFAREAPRPTGHRHAAAAAITAGGVAG